MREQILLHKQELQTKLENYCTVVYNLISKEYYDMKEAHHQQGQITQHIGYNVSLFGTPFSFLNQSINILAHEKYVGTRS